MRTWLSTVLVAIPSCLALPPEQLVPAGDLRVENVQVVATDAAQALEFDVVNAGDREAVAWLVKVTTKPKGWTYLWSDQACGTKPLAPEETRHCRRLAFEWNVQQLAVTAVVFAGGSTAGDLKALREEGENRARLSAVDAYWSRRAHEIAASFPAPEALWRLDREIRSPVEIPGYDVHAAGALIELDILRGYVQQRMEAMKPGGDADALKRVLADLDMSVRDRAGLARRVPLRLSEEPPPQAGPPEVENLTRGLEVVRLERLGGGPSVRLVLKNSYDRPVMAYTISERQDGGMRRSGGADGDCGFGLAPGAVAQEWITTGGPIVISSAVFEDGSGDGDQVQVQETVEVWHRQREVLRQNLPLVQGLLQLSDEELPAATRELIVRLSPEGAKNGPLQCRQPDSIANDLKSGLGLPVSLLRRLIRDEVNGASVRLKRP